MQDCRRKKKVPQLVETSKRRQYNQLTHLEIIKYLEELRCALAKPRQLPGINLHHVWISRSKVAQLAGPGYTLHTGPSGKILRLSPEILGRPEFWWPFNELGCSRTPLAFEPHPQCLQGETTISPPMGKVQAVLEFPQLRFQKLLCRTYSEWHNPGQTEGLQRSHI